MGGFCRELDAALREMRIDPSDEEKRTLFKALTGAPMMEHLLGCLGNFYSLVRG